MESEERGEPCLQNEELHRWYRVFSTLWALCLRAIRVLTRHRILLRTGLNGDFYLKCTVYFLLLLY